MFNFIKKVTEENKIIKADIQSIEEEFEIRFPKKLVDFLLQYNGAEIYLCEITSSGINYEIANLVPVKHGKLPAEKVMEWDRMDGIIKEGLIPIASDRGGNMFYIDSKTDEILLYLSDDIENPKLVSSNFQEFVERITVLTDSY